MWRSIFVFAALAIGALSAAAQTGTLTGIVSDAITGEALIQATVRIGNTGVATDFDGKYAVSLPYGSHEITVQYIGYESKTRTIEVNRQLVQSNFKLSTIVLQEAQVVADVAIERETPVAFSNIKPVQIQEELGSQPIPMILNSTPGVYATQAGSDDNGPSISIRGFKQRNVSVLVDGIPVNDMESGAVFWNNWFGLDLVTQTMQVQRGLGASKLALPAIGGTVNIVTSGIESSRKTSVKQEFGSFGFSRTSIGHTSGRLDGGWGYTMAGSFQNRQGYFQQDYNRAFFYYVKVQKALGNHTLSVSATGSPSQNAARGYQQRIATHNKEYARSLFEGTDEEYAELMAYSQGYDGIFNDGTLLQQEELAAYDSLNQAYGYGSSDDFEEIVSSTDFIDTTGIVSYGDTYNVHWGEVNDNVLYERQNKYHKPLFSLRHSWRATEKLYISNMAYASYGFGGGTRLENSLGGGDYTANGQVDFQKFYNSNTIGGLFGPPIDPTYSDSLLKSGRIMRKLFNNHYWYGFLSTFRHETSEQVTLSGGLDFRTYQGEHYAEVFDLLGGDYFVDTRNANAESNMRMVGDKIGYHNDAFVRWGGAFALLEYKGYLWNAFFNVSGVTQGYKSVDYFAAANEDGTDKTSGWKWLPGFTLKTGGNYNLSEYANTFVNLGHLNRTPVFRNVVDFENKFVENVENERINSAEWGYSFSKYPFSVNVNAYYTDWQNRPLQSLLRFETVEGDIVRANVNSMSALHKGLETDVAWQLNPRLTIEGYASLGDWRWTSSEDSLVLLDDDSNLPYIDVEGNVAIVQYNAEGVSVGDSPQSQYSVSLKYTYKQLYLKPRFTVFSRHFADFDPFSLNGENEGRQSWQIPTYGLLDLHAGYRLDLNGTNMDFRLSIFNLLNTVYLSNAQNNDAYGEWYFTDANRKYAFSENNFDAGSASVYMGYGFRTNLSVRIRF
ncbi:TonB-dependent receptor [Flavobacteriales bacterium]|jgi:outer membrane cobalamin receptor|nr:TonB-dependent receptor [Flavobacteriales bacterium]